MGVKFNSEDLKLKLELSKNFIKTGVVAKFNPQDSKFYFKTELNLTNQKLLLMIILPQELIRLL
ncbi:hypothetical protein CRYPA_1400 [uncultured Candidatus Thioglobus sp.]|nr:hypothetical protein CRYPA_1400 [uncultured Candidatus Thioglobus sp.]